MVKKVTNSLIVGLYLNDYGKKYYLRELASLLRKPHQTIKPYVNLLVEETVLVKEERKNITEYALDFRNEMIYDSLVIAEKERLKERLKEDLYLKVLFEKLSSFFNTTTFIIFGSAVKKIEKGSDIDLLIIGKKKVDSVLYDFEEAYNKKIHRIQLSDIKQLTPALTKEIYKKHLIFNNTEQIIRFWGNLYEENKLV